jgi:alpha-aminoadipic semialdehyde synthase
LALKGPLKLLAISDVTCDIEGSIKLLDKSYTPDNPFFSYDPLTERRGSWA